MGCWAVKLNWCVTDDPMKRHGSEEGDGLVGAEWYRAKEAAKVEDGN